MQQSLTSERHLDLVCRVLSVVHGYGLVTSGQLYDFVGTSHEHQMVDRAVRYAYELELVRLNTWPGTQRSSPSGRRAYLLAAGPSAVYDAIIRPRISFAHDMAITAGQPWRGSGHPMQRHNLLATELCLRAAKHSRVHHVLGERYTRVDLLASHAYATSPHLSELVPPSKAADGLLVRHDGARIVIEITRNTNGQFADKVRDWLRLLQWLPPEGRHFFVLFVVAPDPRPREERHGRTTSRKAEGLCGSVRRVIQREAEALNMAADKVEKVGVIEWADWFPAPPASPTARFDDLNVDALSHVGGEYCWTSMSLLESNQFWIGREAQAAAEPLLDNVQRLACVPPWMVDPGDNPGYWTDALMLNAAWMDFPTPPPAKPERWDRDTLGSPRGAVSRPTRMPKRLRWPPVA